MYDFTRGCVGALFFVGAVWLAGLVRFAGGFLVALARLLALPVFLFIVDVLEMHKGPERTPCARWMFCGWPEAFGERFRLLRSAVQSLCPERERLNASHLRFCDYEYIASSIISFSK
jgi:hypothetical protein